MRDGVLGEIQSDEVEALLQSMSGILELKVVSVRGICVSGSMS